jgi:hypothetical protein
VHEQQELARQLRRRGCVNPRIMTEAQKQAARERLEAELEAELAERAADYNAGERFSMSDE